MSVEAKEGLILAPLITGTHEFVNETELGHSQHILGELTRLLIAHNPLRLTFAELEGEALFFFRHGKPPPLEAIEGQIHEWSRRFHARRVLLKRQIFCDCGVCLNVAHLGLRVVGHYGEFGVQRIGGRTKILGKEVILVHRLTGTGRGGGDGLVLTRSLLERVAENGTPARFSGAEEDLPVFGTVPLAVRDLSDLREAAPPEVIAAPAPTRHVAGEMWIDARLDRVVPLLVDIAGWPAWMEGVRRVDLDRSEPVRPGHRHLCYLPEGQAALTVDFLDNQPDSFSLVFRVQPSVPLMRGAVIELRARSDGGGSRVAMTYGIAPMPGTDWLFGRMMARRMRERVDRSLGRLRVLAGQALDPQVDGSQVHGSHAHGSQAHGAQVPAPQHRR